MYSYVSGSHLAQQEAIRIPEKRHRSDVDNIISRQNVF